MIVRLVFVGIGAVLGAWLKWTMGIFLNPIFSTISLGTLSVSLIGGFLMEMMMGFSRYSSFFQKK